MSLSIKYMKRNKTIIKITESGRKLVTVKVHSWFEQSLDMLFQTLGW